MIFPPNWLRKRPSLTLRWPATQGLLGLMANRAQLVRKAFSSELPGLHRVLSDQHRARKAAGVRC